MSDKTGLAHGVSIVMRGFDWSGRSGRLAFVVPTVCLIAATLVREKTLVFSTLNTVAIVASAFLLVLFFGHMRRRLRDLDISGWAIWLSFVPILNLLFVLYLALKKGTTDLVLRGSSFSRTGFIVVCCLGLLMLVRVFWAPYWIPAGSMKPTLQIGDYLAVTRAGVPKRGDVLVFRHPVTQRDYIKRLIGLPGDKVQMIDGRLILNGQPVDLGADGKFSEPMVPQGAYGSRPRCANGALRTGEICEKDKFVETLPEGAQYAVLNISDGPLDNTAVFDVPEGNYFFLGDNRDNSADSRTLAQAGGLGFVPRENVVGRATRVLFSSRGKSLWQVWTWRSDRFAKDVL